MVPRFSTGEPTMGVTVSTAKLAAAYQANNGQTVYVLFE